jgi:Transposase DDE domain
MGYIQGDGTLFGGADFRYEPDSDTYVCPGDKRLLRKHTNHKDRYTMYKAPAGDCGTCSLKSRCTQAPRRGLARHLYEEALNWMQARVTPEVMRLRRCTVQHPYATIKYRIFRHPRLLMRGLSGAGRDRPRDDGIQPQAHHECSRRNQTDGSAASRLIERNAVTRTPKS